MQKRKSCLLGTIFFISFCLSMPALSEHVFGETDLTELPFETLLTTEYLEASEAARQISQAHTAVSIVTAKDIQNYGYRTIAEILRSMPGLYLSTYGPYELLGGRGFSNPDDYAGRIMLMIDGYVTTENFFNQIFLGEEALIDVDLIDRVEFVPGPGAITFGASAVLGVVNITTKKGSDIDGVQASVDVSNDSQQRKRLSVGHRFDNGFDLLLSASDYEGRDFHLPQEAKRLFVKASYEGLRFQYAESSRDTDATRFVIFPPFSDAYEADQNKDKSRYVSLQYDRSLTQHLQFAGHIYKGRYEYESGYETFPNPGVKFVTHEESFGEWWGADIKFVSTHFDRHRLLFGGEYRQNLQQKSGYTDTLVIAGDTAFEFSDELNVEHTSITSLYIQDEFQATDKLTFIGGLRYDEFDLVFDIDELDLKQRAYSPRLAAIYTPSDTTRFKLSWGKAHSFISPHKLVKLNPENFEPYQTKRPEQVSTTELVWEQQLTDTTKLTTAIFYNQVDDALAGTSPQVDTFGQELRLEYIRPYGTRFDLSVTHQQVENKDSPDPIYNSPEWVAKLNVAQPLFNHQWMLGLNIQAISNRETFGLLQYGDDGDGDFFIHARRGEDVGWSTIVNANLSSDSLIKNSHISLHINNLFGSKQPYMYGPPSANNFDEHQRSIWLKYELTLP